MSQGNQSCLRFTLEESVWFQRGQEVAELVSISLDPNITIQENEQYVAIRGSLELTGEYKCDEQQEDGADQIPALKFVHSIMEREEGVYEFLHRFPVDITIPKNRIESIYDIDINVESFDYVFPEKDRLKLNADLSITGLYGEQQHGGSQEEDRLEDGEAEEAAEDSSHPDLDFPEVPAYSFVQENKVLQDTDPEDLNEDLYAPFRAEARKTGIDEEPAQSEQQQELALAHAEREYSYNDFRNEQAPAQPAEEPAAKVEVTQPAENPAAEVEEEESSSSPEKVIKKKKPTMKKGISIAEFLARKEEEVEVAKIRVCIVQQGDTLQVISERYDVPVQQLLKVNHLSIDHEVKEGQVLYVPGFALHNH